MLVSDGETCVSLLYEPANAASGISRSIMLFFFAAPWLENILAQIFWWFIALAGKIYSISYAPWSRLSGYNESWIIMDGYCFASCFSANSFKLFFSRLTHSDLWVSIKSISNEKINSPHRKSRRSTWRLRLRLVELYLHAKRCGSPSPHVRDRRPSPAWQTAKAARLSD